MVTKSTVPLKGTIRIRKDLQICEWSGKIWVKSSKNLPNAMHAVELFKAHNNFKEILDTKNPKFLKGQLSPNDICQGARLNILPDGEKLNGAYSLFALDLSIHDELNNNHWDVMYKNKGGSYGHLYTIEKHEKLVKKKFNTVNDFSKHYAVLKRNATAALRNYDDNLALPMYTMLKTYMRVGNEIYYKAHGHKGLTTLKKKDISINGNDVTFKYIAKSGVPREICCEFPDTYIKRLKKMLTPLKKSDFIFTSGNGHPISDMKFKEAFKKYCGKEYYPHIIRSHYATQRAKEFIKAHKKATKEEVQILFLSIADKLGHKHFNKKKELWEDNYNVTIHHYIQPELVTKVESLIE